MSSSSIPSFRRTVWKYYTQHGRHDLPWRKTKDPYQILVSEVMLQQTQVVRVIEKYREFLKQFPTVQALADARLSDVLKIWSGLGYNRRGKYLHDAAKVIVDKYGGKVPKDKALLKALPGLGEYTAGAVRVFAFNEPDVLIETNIRAVYIHHFFSDTSNTHDREVLMVAERSAKGQDPREWHWELMDYGAHLKRSGVRNNVKSKHYTKQSRFKGSLREVRGALLRSLHKRESLNKLSFEQERIQNALASLARDGLVKQMRGKWRIA